MKCPSSAVKAVLFLVLDTFSSLHKATYFNAEYGSGGRGMESCMIPIRQGCITHPNVSLVSVAATSQTQALRHPSLDKPFRQSRIPSCKHHTPASPLVDISVSRSGDAASLSRRPLRSLIRLLCRWSLCHVRRCWTLYMFHGLNKCRWYSGGVVQVPRDLARSNTRVVQLFTGSSGSHSI